MHVGVLVVALDGVCRGRCACNGLGMIVSKETEKNTYFWLVMVGPASW